VYTGRGWSRSEERREAVAADNWLVLPSAAQTVQITQTVSWVFDERAIRYTLGLPFAMDQPMSVRWRGVDDLVRVLGQGDVVYTAFSRGSKATVADLRGAPLATVPPVLLARYTALPNTVPQRVHDLAMEITAGGETPYDKAKAVETFLRQYPYSLDVSAPPAQVDPVDYFLFDLQAGYCDYYASAMVVLLRSAGIPARVGIGYLVQPPDENGVQTVVQLNAHSWAEVYFADYGWIEFEPTAPFASPFPDETDGIDNAGNNETIPPPFDESFVPPPIPDQADAQRPFNWVLWLGVVVGIGGLGIIWFRFAQRQRELDGVALAYEGLQNQARRLGVATPASQTPHEFASAFQAWLVAKEGSYEPDSWWGKRLGMVNAGILQLTQLFVHRQYRGWNPVENVQEANTIWQKIKPSLWQWRIKTQINAFRLRKNKQFLDKHQT
jgi:transglutaminase-like putative cysteine protease